MDDSLRDLDETRRLLYIAWAATAIDEPHHTLVGTLMNALRHHSTLYMPPETTLSRLQALLAMNVNATAADARDDASDALEWLSGVIDDITSIYEHDSERSAAGPDA